MVKAKSTYIKKIIENLVISNNKVKQSYIDSIRESNKDIDKLKDIENITNGFMSNDNISRAYI